MHRLTKKADSGFTIVEMLVVLVLIGLVASIVTPIIANNQKQADRAVAIADGRVWAITLANMLVPYVDYGTGTVSYSSVDGTLSASLLSPSPSSPSEISAPVSGSVGTSLADSAISGRDWCLVVVNKDQTAVYTPLGFQPAATTCTDSGLPE